MSQEDYRRKLANRPREQILAEWDKQPLSHREMCAHILLRTKMSTQEALIEVSKNGWNATKSDLTGGMIAMEIAMDLLAHKGNKETAGLEDK